MTRTRFFGFLGAAAVAARTFGQAPQQPAAAKTHLKIGDEAPDFALPASNGKQVKLSDYRGKSSVVLAFFPAAFTGGCTKEMQAYQAGFGQFESSNAQVFGISTDPLPTLRHWADEHLKTPVPLLSDFMRKVSATYGILNTERGVASRTTFVVDQSGKIQHIDENAAAVDISGAAAACSRLKKT
ncbi:MAG TPA: redoxin domain-containing protein [Bryobacteraceae bacterium]|nr:redoxin domain-containing protein [Bryobacteraceae bacterium]